MGCALARKRPPCAPRCSSGLATAPWSTRTPLASGLVDALAVLPPELRVRRREVALGRCDVEETHGPRLSLRDTAASDEGRLLRSSPSSGRAAALDGCDARRRVHRPVPDVRATRASP